MDSCRWDSFTIADTPNIDSLGKAIKVHSPAGWTAPSMFHLLTNAPYFGNPRTRFVPTEKGVIWVPKTMAQKGYHNVFFTPNQVIYKYTHAFRQGFHEVDWYWGEFKYTANRDVDNVIRVLKEVEQPKFILTLCMATHKPFAYKKDLPKEFFESPTQGIEFQVRSIESLDKEFGRVLDVAENAIITVYSDHGTLFKELEGYDGHGQWLMHPKLFEVPFIRGKV